MALFRLAKASHVFRAVGCKTIVSKTSLQMNVVSPMERNFVFNSAVFSREFSFFANMKDKMTQKLEERNEGKQEEVYKQQMQNLASMKEFNLEMFRLYLQQTAEIGGMSGWKSKLPGISSMPGVKQLKDSMAILEATDLQIRENPEQINGRIKRQISEKCGHSVEEINNLLRNYSQISALTSWLRKRKERNLPLPESVEETQEMIREDPTGFPSKQFKKKKRY